MHYYNLHKFRSMEVQKIGQQKLATKLVQEMSKTGDVPEKYLLKDGFTEAIDTPDMWTDSLLIDLSILTSSSLPTGAAELAKFRSALCEWGCFLVKNHGFKSSFLEEMIEVTKEFFTLPLEEKHKCVGLSNDIFQGYGNDRAYRDIPVTANWNDRLFVTLSPEQKRNLQFWPQKPEKLRPMLEEYTKNLKRINEAIYKAMARSLNLEEECFLNSQGKDEEIMGKLSMYPRCPCPNKVQGHQQHSDGSTMSIILVEKDVQGLEVLKDDLWFKVPVIPGALFINIGDFGEVKSNGVFKSAVHRVTTNSSTDRTSVVAFCHPENGDEVAPIKEFVEDSQPRKFRSFSLSEYRGTYFNDYALGRSTLQSYKL